MPWNVLTILVNPGSYEPKRLLDNYLAKVLICWSSQDHVLKQGPDLDGLRGYVKEFDICKGYARFRNWKERVLHKNAWQTIRKSCTNYMTICNLFEFSKFGDKYLWHENKNLWPHFWGWWECIIHEEWSRITLWPWNTDGNNDWIRSKEHDNLDFGRYNLYKNFMISWK